MRLKEVMTPEAECIAPNDTILHAAERMRDLDVGAMPVCGSNDKLVGMITDRDIAIRAVAEGLDPKKGTVGEVMTPEIVFCFEDDDVERAAQRMEEKKIRRLPVLNRDKRLVGIVSLGDLAVKSGNEHLSAEALREISEPVAPAR